MHNHTVCKLGIIFLVMNPHQVTFGATDHSVAMPRKKDGLLVGLRTRLYPTISLGQILTGGGTPRTREDRVHATGSRALRSHNPPLYKTRRATMPQQHELRYLQQHELHHQPSQHNKQGWPGVRVPWRCLFDTGWRGHGRGAATLSA